MVCAHARGYAQACGALEDRLLEDCRRHPRADRAGLLPLPGPGHRHRRAGPPHRRRPGRHRPHPRVVPAMAGPQPRHRVKRGGMLSSERWWWLAWLLLWPLGGMAADDPVAAAAERIAAEAGEHGIVVLGEMHGTREAP